MSCSAPIAAAVYTGRDNVISLVLEADGERLADLSAVTRVTVDLDGGMTVIDSDVVGASVIWWTDQVSYRGALTDVLRLQLGDQSLAVGTYDDVEIILFDVTYPLGLRIETPVRITVHE